MEMVEVRRPGRMVGGVGSDSKMGTTYAASKPLNASARGVVITSIDPLKSQATDERW
jgi:hypothetical protein